MTQPSTSTDERLKQLERRVEDLSDRTAGFFARLGVERFGAGVLLVVGGVLVLVFPQLLVWAVGVGTVAIGVMLMVSNPARSRQRREETAPAQTPGEPGPV